jgi:hypothetical protein
MSIPGITNASTSIRLTVSQDIATPQIVAAYGMGDTLTLNFNAPLIKITNYTLSSGFISRADIVDSRYSALLAVTGMVDQSFNIILSGIIDTIGNHWGSITAQGIYNHLQSSDIHDSKATSGDGYLTATGKAVPLSNKDFDIFGSGNGIQGTQDACQFAYEPWQGDFDAIVKVESLEPTGRWAKAGIMFRESLDPKSKCIWVAVTPQGPLTLDPIGKGLDQYETGVRLTYGGFAGDWPTAGPTNTTDVHYPNAWIHIRRIHTDTSDRYIASRSDDGVHWTLMQTVELAGPQSLASQGYLGLFVTSQDSYPGTDLTQVKFRQYFPVIPLDWGWPMPNLANLRAIKSAGSLDVTWRNEAGAMILQSTTNLKSNAGDSDWQDITANILDDGTNKTWRINNPGNNHFFRLIFK